MKYRLRNSPKEGDRKTEGNCTCQWIAGRWLYEPVDEELSTPNAEGQFSAERR